ncbi:MAG: hypothetical protein A3J93_04245 [Candidatus Magasanikbacteria bacterium RIFOXYC2_FULL_42_28]|uniref:Uncharacterized protein n=1 Tax=Candidatus Magasanikbacteria bacterium RIFOXYC2_FULL_42_28 TaxID=1798704 RepID=A0A1F6NWZ7_9BACT|nr:MAG: hypothetical protein A3J93_04245 [Candidatus Magasanikbacteria bacterium RIFOXYC2_FULL_42_28]
MNKILYLWDLAGTLFPEKWNKELTHFDSYEEYIKLKGVDNATEPRKFEEGYEEVYKLGNYFNLQTAKGFKEVLSLTKNNEAFSTGLAECMDWRAEYLNPKVGFNIRSFFQKINSTFDYGETNVKTEAMLVDYLSKKVLEGYDTVVYTDDKFADGVFFKNAAETVKAKNPDFSYRFYHILNDEGGARPKDWYCEIGGLMYILKIEKV